MKIHLHEITDLETELDFTETDRWTVQAVERMDEIVTEKTRPPMQLAIVGRAMPRPVHAHFSLRKVDGVVVASGDIKTYVKLFCSRCAEEFHFDLSAHFSSLFCQDPVMAGVGHLEAQGKPAGQHKGFARHAHDADQDELMAEGKDLDITYLSEDFIDLQEVIMEQIQLQIPFQPLCKAECKGICVSCGADLNIGRCACARVALNNSFSVLKNLKL